MQCLSAKFDHLLFDKPVTLLILKCHAGVGARRKREGLLDNVDPLDSNEESPTDRDKERASSSSTQQEETDLPGTSGSGAWADNYQNGSTSRGGNTAAGSTTQEGGGPWSSNGRSSQSGNDDNGWGARPKPVTEDWGWGQAAARSRRAAAAASNGSPSQAWGGTGEPGNGAAPAEDDASAWAEDAEEASPDTAWDSKEAFPDIVELQPQELVHLYFSSC